MMTLIGGHKNVEPGVAYFQRLSSSCGSSRLHCDSGQELPRVQIVIFHQVCPSLNPNKSPSILHKTLLRYVSGRKDSKDKKTRLEQMYRERGFVLARKRFTLGGVHLQSLRIPMARHFWRRQYWHRFRWCLVTSQSLLPRHW